MPSITADLAALLSTVNRPGDFFASGKIEVFAPRLEVEGVGPVALPLLSVQAEQFVATAEAAPYGRGDETVLDTNVRRTWQIGAERARIGGSTGRRRSKRSLRMSARASASRSRSRPSCTSC